MASLSELLYDIKRISEHRKELTDKKIKKIYQSLSKSLDTFIADGYKKYADNDGRFYISYLDAQNKKAKFLREIAENVASVTPEIKKEILSLVDDTYSKSYQGMMTAFKKADTSEKFEEITRDIEVNLNVLKSAVDNNINKLTLPAVLEKHRQEVIYQVQKELNIGLMQGDRYEKMAKRISERVNVSYNKAMNITRTETHRNIESGFMDCAEHIQKGLENSNFIYAVTWRTMKDERVRPSQRRKTKKGWVTGKSKNGANHQIMEGVTVKVGELFDLGDGVKAKAPSQTGVAGHDCNCRCFLEYNLMTVEEFEKKTGQKIIIKEAPKINIVNSSLRKYTSDEINYIANETDKIATKYINIKSKWSGNIVINNNLELYGKLWNCDIATMSETAPHIILHEHLHARSISYFDIETYREYRKIEEASVQFLTQEISKIEKIKIIESEYDDMVNALRKINSKLNNSVNDLEFSKQLFEIPVKERLDWLNNEIYTKTERNISIKEFSELTEFLNILC